MYQVSDAYKNAMHQPVQKFRLTGTVGTTPFSDENILQGSFSITNQCSDNNEIKIGQVYIGELDVTLIDTNLARYSLKNKIIKPYFGLMLANESYEDVPLGQFIISQADWTASGIAIKAYDNMSKLDKSCNINSAQGMPYALAKMACDNCGVELGTTQTEFSILRTDQKHCPCWQTMILKRGVISCHGWHSLVPAMSWLTGMEKSYSRHTIRPSLTPSILMNGSVVVLF